MSRTLVGQADAERDRAPTSVHPGSFSGAVACRFASLAGTRALLAERSERREL